MAKKPSNFEDLEKFTKIIVETCRNIFNCIKYLEAAATNKGYRERV